MPCQSDYGQLYDRGDNCADIKAKLKTQKDKTNELTEMLCILSRYLEAAERSDLFDSTPGLKAWWTHHKKLDAAEAKRKAEASAKKAEKRRLKEVATAALLKLTPEERRALKLK
jgi:hypothetical protein